jgi:low temperature requirement protein LtrA
MVTHSSIASPEDQGVTFVELFFDLVFVFSVTQIVGHVHHHLDWLGVGQSVLVFWLVWWAWSQFTWALNAADTTHPAVELGTLVATGVSFFMAVALPNAFSGGAAWFAIPYVLVRVIGLGLYIWVAWQTDPSKHAAVRTFSLMSVGGLVAVLAGGFAGGSTLYWLWGIAILLDVVAALAAGEREGWDLHPEHFGERHGLFVIIALGESLIVTGGGLSKATVTANLIAAGTLAVAATCALWWSYFACGKPALDQALAQAPEAERSKLGRDVYSLLHFPMILGVIGFAAAIEGIVLHPADPLTLEARLALAMGVALFTGGRRHCRWRHCVVRRLPRDQPFDRVRRCLATGRTGASKAGGEHYSPLVTVAIFSRSQGSIAYRHIHFGSVARSQYKTALPRDQAVFNEESQETLSVADQGHRHGRARAGAGSARAGG